jgi:ribonuclease III
LIPLLKRLKDLFNTQSSKEQKFVRTIAEITGQTPVNIDLYKLAVCHTSVAKELKAGVKNSNERLEYLGDAVLGVVVAEYLFKKFPYKTEGFLTEIRSRIVNRESLNKVGKKIGLHKIVEFNSGRHSGTTHKSLYGDALEALVGAVYLDKGFKKCRNFILLKIIQSHFDLEEIVEMNLNFKSMLIEWAQKDNKPIKFVIINEFGSTHQKEFTAQVIIDDKPIGTGSGQSKKKAEQNAAEMACKELGIK